MKSKPLNLSLLLLCFAWLGDASAQDSSISDAAKPDDWKFVRDVDEFQELLIKAVDAREKIRAGDFQYKLSKFDKRAEVFFVEQEGRLLFNYDDREYLHLWTIKEKERTQQSASSPVEIVGDFRTASFGVLSLEGNSWICKDTDPIPMPITGAFELRAKRLLFPFDFRTFGIALFAEYKEKTDLVGLTTNYLTWPTPREMKNSDGDLIWRSLGDLKMDVSGDFWITKNYVQSEVMRKVGKKQVRTGKYVTQSGCDIDLTIVGGSHVPKKVIYQNRKERHVIELEWLSLNAPFDDQALSKASLVNFVVSQAGKDESK